MKPTYKHQHGRTASTLTSLFSKANPTSKTQEKEDTGFDLSWRYVFSALSFASGIAIGFNFNIKTFLLLLVVTIHSIYFGIKLLKQKHLHYSFIPFAWFYFGTLTTLNISTSSSNIIQYHNATIEGKVVSRKSFQRSQVLTLKDVKVNNLSFDKITVYSNKRIKVPIGVVVKFVGNVKPVYYNQLIKKMPQKAFFSLNPKLQTYINRPPKVLIQPNKFDIVSQSQKFHDYIKKRILSSRGSRNSKGITSSILIGDQSLIDEEARKEIQLSGLSHLLAISGLHIAIIAGGAFLASRKIMLMSQTLHYKIDIKKISGVVSLLFGVAYILISSAPISAIRSLVFFLLFVIGIITDRESSTLRTWSTTFIAILVAKPALLFTASFQMSFAATFGLITGLNNLFKDNASNSLPINTKQKTTRMQQITNKLLQAFTFVKNIFTSSILANVATLFFGVYHFGYFSLAGLFANIISIPIVEIFSLPAAFIGALVSPLKIDRIFYSVSNIANIAVLYIAKLYSKFSLLIVNIHSFTGVHLAISTVLLVILSYYRTMISGVFVLILSVSLLAHARLSSRPDFIIDQRQQALIYRIDSQYYSLAANKRVFLYAHQKNLGQEIKSGHLHMEGRDGIQINCTKLLSAGKVYQTDGNRKQKDYGIPFICNYKFQNQCISIIFHKITIGLGTPLEEIKPQHAIITTKCSHAINAINLLTSARAKTRIIDTTTPTKQNINLEGFDSIFLGKFQKNRIMIQSAPYQNINTQIEAQKLYINKKEEGL